MKEKLLVLAKAYPEYSKKYNYTICTAGITEDGEWRRIYPIPFDIYLKSKYSKRDWIEYEIRGSADNIDARKESRKIELKSIKIIGKEDTESVRSILRSRITDIEILKQDNKIDKTSLGVIKPRLDGFSLRDRDMDISKKNFLKYQSTLFPTFKPDLFDKLPSYKFRCCETCAGHDVVCEDIEAIEFYRKLKDKYGDSPECDIGLKTRLFDWMKERDLYFVIGTHFRFGTPLIISLIYPKYRGEPLNRFF